LAIQGLHNITDETQINLGFDSSLFPRIFTINVDKKEGLLKEVQIYLKDNVTQIIHDLNQSAYEFDYKSLAHNKSRFTLILAQKGAVLGVDEEQINNKFIVSLHQKNIYVNSPKKVENIKIYSILGKLLINANPEKEEFELNTSHFSSGNILIINALLEDGSRINKKIIN
jgi:hypothetical protein